MIKRCSIILVAIALLFPRAAYAVSLTITNNPQTISSEPFTLSVTIDGAQAGTNYLRVDIYKESTTNYFGETYNGSDWYGDSEHAQYLPVQIESGQAKTIEVQARIGSPTIGEYDDQGSYKIRVRRYTSSGNYNSDESNNGSVSVNIDAPTASPTPAPSPSPTPESNQSSSTTSTSKSPTPKATPKTTAKKSPSPTPQVLSVQAGTPSTQSAQQRGIENSIAQVDPNQFDAPDLESNSQQAPNKFAALLVGSGAVMIGISTAGFLWYKRQENHTSIQKERQRFEEDQE